ncbi:endonuclease YncB(thermonuclease family) [Rhodoblastus acidophilus]|uniref:thermonuclease family protein n=1 Tax=Rhodoblastus acidophilus TaxID=1074 RepID=UPI00222437B8|nr:thermonuclease family protein [Rhodoblastus acidophilus]MCW2286517.1 endonuclease YncB(thermonuclease family) [Rhodoblastus acidophilus]MCW2335366.1 endonuclease YncB(thermonuclease family) [Rhodoblastus acidophilus]
MKSPHAISALALLLVIAPACAQQPAAAEPKASPAFDIPQSGVEFQTGDTWEQNGQTFRLYAVQSCIRQTYFTNPAGLKTDCCEASLNYLAAIIRDTKPRCTAIAQAGQPPVIYAVCAAHIGANTLDLGTVLISQGFALAALDANGKPIHFPYVIAEDDARSHRRGLWAAPDFPNPNKILADAARAARQPASAR